MSFCIFYFFNLLFLFSEKYVMILTIILIVLHGSTDEGQEAEICWND